MNVAPAYAHVLLGMSGFLQERSEACEAAGIAWERIALDPGIGFGKRGAQNAALLQGLPLPHGLGCPVLAGLSRKRFSDSMEGR